MNVPWKTQCLDGTWHLFIEKHKECASIANDLTTLAALQKANFYQTNGSVPGNFELDLVRDGILPDPFLGENPILLQQYENRHLWYVTTFLSPAKEGEDWYLQFDGIDTVADIYLNGDKIGSADNMFVEHIYPVALKAGENELVVHITPSMIAARDIPLGAGINTHLNYNAASLGLRRPAHTYGWDIFPRIVSGGIWRSVTLLCKPANRIDDVMLATGSTEGNGDIMVYTHYCLTVTEDLIHRYSISFHGECGEHSFDYTQRLWHTEETRYIRVHDPVLWWPQGMGKPNMYHVTVKLMLDGEVLDTRELDFGIRQAKLVRTELIDERGQGEFCFTVNGQKMFARGTNWVPLDSFHSRDKERLAKALELLADEARAFGPADRISRAMSVLSDASSEMRTAPNQRLVLELAFTRIARPEGEVTMDALAERVAVLEARLAQLEAGESLRAPVAPAVAPAPEVAQQAVAEAPVSQPTNNTAAGQAPQAPAAAVSAAPATRAPQPRSAQPQAAQPQAAVPAPAPQTVARPAAAPATAARPVPAQAPAAAAPQPSAPARSAAVTDAGDLQRRWRQVCEELLASAPSRGSLLMNSNIESDDGNTLLVTLPKGSTFAAKMLERPDVRAIIDPLVARVFGPRHIAYAESLDLIEHGDAGLREAHHRAHAHARGNDGVDAVVGKQLHGAQATAFLVRGIVDRTDFGDLAIDDREDREAVAMSEVTAALSVDSGFTNGRNCKLECAHGFPLSLVLSLSRNQFSTSTRGEVQ
jgi:hypothetical protein